jgi:hypothetical protein
MENIFREAQPGGSDGETRIEAPRACFGGQFVELQVGVLAITGRAAPFPKKPILRHIRRLWPLFGPIFAKRAPSPGFR